MKEACTLDRELAMIPPDLLNQITRIITHADCPDGLASAMILHDALPNAEVVFVNYGRPEREEMPATPGQLWCDMTPPEARVQEFVTAGAIVLDHHKGAEGVVRAFGERGVFADEKLEPGVSGAVLAFREVWEPFGGGHGYRVPIQDFAALAGIRDTWQKSHPCWREALIAYHALMLHPWDYWRYKPPYLNDDDLVVGAALLAKREREVEQAAANALIQPVSILRPCPGASNDPDAFETETISLALVNVGYALASDVSDFLRERRDVDLVLAFRYEMHGQEPILRISTRSNGRFDCAHLAKAFGGGGHSRAAGFEIRYPQFRPVGVFRHLVAAVRLTPQPKREA